MQAREPLGKTRKKRGGNEALRGASSHVEWLCRASLLARTAVALIALSVCLSAFATFRLPAQVQNSLPATVDGLRLKGGHEGLDVNSTSCAALFTVSVPRLAVQSDELVELGYGTLVMGAMQRDLGHFEVYYPLEGVVSIYDAEIGLERVDVVGMTQHLAAQCDESSWLANTDLTGGDVNAQPLAVISAAQCCRHCVVDAACSAWTFDEKRSMCWMKNGAVAKASKSPGMLSGKHSKPRNTHSTDGLRAGTAPSLTSQSVDAMWLDGLAPNWTRAHFIGNGKLGAIVGMYPQPGIMRIPISSDRIYAKRIPPPPKPNQVSKLDAYRRAKQLMLVGNITAAEKVASALSGGTVGGFQYAAELSFQFGAFDRAAAAAQTTTKQRVTRMPKYLPFTMPDPRQQQARHELALFARRNLQFEKGLVQESVLTLEDKNDSQAHAHSRIGDTAVPALTAHHREWFVSRAHSTLVGWMSCHPLLQRPSAAGCLDVDVALGRDDDGQWQKKMRVFELGTGAGALRQLDNVILAPQKYQAGRTLVLELEVVPKPSTAAPTIVTYVGVSTDGHSRPYWEERLGDFRIQLRNATNLVTITSICVFYPHEVNDCEVCRQRVVETLNRGYWSNRAAHVKNFEARYHQASLKWKPAARSSDDSARKLLQTYNLGRYMALSGTHPQAQPMNLQGIWADGLIAAWRGDYHMNINLQMAYWPLPAAGLFDALPPFYSFLDRLVSSGTVTAKEMYNARGWVAHGYTDIWMGTTPWDEMQWSLCVSCGGWVALQAWDAYLYRPDDTDILLKTIVPALRGALVFFQDYTFPLDDGTVVTGPTTSPETSYELIPTGGLRSKTASRQFHQLTFAPTIDIAVISELIQAFEHCMAVMRTLGVDVTEEDKQVLQNAKALLGAMPNKGKPTITTALSLSPSSSSSSPSSQQLIAEYTVNSIRGTVLAEPDPGHRHFSSLIGLYPFSGQFFDDPAARNAAANTLKHKISQGGGHTNWSAVWAAALFARLFDGNSAWQMLQSLLDRFTMDNGVTFHPVLEPLLTAKCMTCYQLARNPALKKSVLEGMETRVGEKFQIDASMGLMAAVHEMLVQSHRPRVIHLLPALPDQLATEGQFAGLSVRGGATVDMSWESGHVTQMTLNFSEAYQRYCASWTALTDPVGGSRPPSCILALTTPNAVSLGASSCAALATPSSDEAKRIILETHVPLRAAVTFVNISAFPCVVRFTTA